MRRVAVLVLTMMFFFGLADWAIAGPFGLSMGMKPSEVGGKLKEHGPGKYRTTEVPQPHSAFKEYLLFFGPKTGLCKIIATSPEVATSGYGTELRSAFERLEARLKVQYGKHERVDFLQKGSIWNEPKDFMTGLLKEERILISYWSMEGGATLKDSISGLMLEAHALSQEKGAISVGYEFQNRDECQKEHDAAEDNAL